MQLIHYSDAPLTEVRDVDPTAKGAGAYKPAGLWFSVGDGEDGWRAWCEAEQWQTQAMRHATEIVLHADAKVLRLSGADAIDRFTEQYGCTPEWASALKGSHFARSIDWLRVAEQHDAIIIAPYCYARRLHEATTWYYGWDCASGVLWRARAVECVRPLTRHESMTAPTEAKDATAG